MEVDSYSTVKGKRLKISPIPKRSFFIEEKEPECLNINSQEPLYGKLSTVQRRLSFDHEITATSDFVVSSENIDEIGHVKIDPYSPPYKRMKSLRVFDASTPRDGRTTPPSKDNSLVSSISTPKHYSRVLKMKLNVSHGSNNLLSRSLNSVPVNPFTPKGRFIVSETIRTKQKHRKAFQEWLSGSSSDDSMQNISDNDISNKSIAGSSLSDLEISRFAEEFKVESFIASGYFGCVYKCINYLDGMEYAIKKSANPVAGTTDEQLARKEVFALAAMKSHRHIVTYYSAWIEDGHLLIQTEYCNGGSLEALIEHDHKVFTDCGLRRLAYHISKGLKYIHSLHLAHMDIKPSNILICKTETILLSSDEDLDEVDKDDIDLVYKIGDLGHMVSVDKPFDVVDGDCRYIARELLNENYKCVQKADVFSFGMTMYEAAGGGPLPKNGDAWQQLRNGDIPYINKYSSNFNQIIRNMLHPDPEKRPTIRSVLQQTKVISASLQQQIYSLKVKNDLYQQQVKARHSPIICDKSIPKIYVEHA